MLQQVQKHVIYRTLMTLSTAEPTIVTWDFCALLLQVFTVKASAPYSCILLSCWSSPGRRNLASNGKQVLCLRIILELLQPWPWNFLYWLLPTYVQILSDSKIFLWLQSTEWRQQHIKLISQRMTSYYNQNFKWRKIIHVSIHFSWIYLKKISHGWLRIVVKTLVKVKVKVKVKQSL
jgi:hypothetical protein